ncbi:MAG: penicillin-binding protein 1A [Thermoanaerobaculia bacterium]
MTSRSIPSPPKSPSTSIRGASSPSKRWSGRWIAWLVAAVVLGGLAGLGVAAAIRVPQVDSLADFSPKLITEIYDRDGASFASYARERRLMLDQNEIPDRFRDAVVAAEDGNFFHHGGIDALSVVRSVIVDLRRGRHAQGASTLTMQVARMLFLTSEKSWKRKISQAFLAVELEKTLSKQQILALYCNLVFLGHNNYGMESAARSYFGHGVKDLSLPEAATLAGIVQRPSSYSPYRHPDRVVARRDYVLRRMFEEGWISDEELRDALATPLTVVHQKQRSELGPYFAEEVRQHLERQYGEDRLYHEGLQVHTTMDAAIQNSAESALRDGLLRLDHRRGFRAPLLRGQDVALDGEQIDQLAGRNPDPENWVAGLVLSFDGKSALVRSSETEFRLEPEGFSWTGKGSARELLRPGDVAWFRQVERARKPGELYWMLEQEPIVEGAVIVLESATGAIRGLVGGWDFRRNKFDRAMQASRQVGSAFKPMVYGAALESGFTAADTLFDAPVVFLGADGLPSYSPRNYYRKYYGVVTLRRALELSVNVTAVKLMDLIGVQRTVDFARRCGITAPLPPYPSLALGSADIVPIELAVAYAAIANQGVVVRPYFVERVAERSGAVLEQHRPDATTSMSPAVAFVLTSMMEGVVDRGTAVALADLPLDIAGKTGTTNDYTDAWFVGFTPRYTILSWVGYDQKRSLGRRMTGAEAALPIWRQIAQDGLRDGWLQEGERFPVPSGVEFRSIEYRTGLEAAPGATRLIQEAFLQGSAPARAYDPRWERILDLPWPQQRPFYTARAGERMPDGLTAETFPETFFEEREAAN